MKTLRKLLFYISLTIGILLIALVASVFLFKDKIINEFIREANKSLNTPVKVGKIDVSVFQQFPKLSIVITDVYVEDSHHGQYPLLTAKKISFQMNPIEVWQGNYKIEGLKIIDSETNFKINADGENNYKILKKTKSTGKETVSFALNNVELEKTVFNYFDLYGKQNLRFSSKALTASIGITDFNYNIKAKGQLTTEKIEIEGKPYLAGKAFNIQSSLIYNDKDKTLLIDPSLLELGKASFNVSGSYAWKEKNLIDLTTEGTNTSIQTILSLLPQTVSSSVEKYRSEGDVYFKSRLKGEIGKNKHPSFSAEFGFDNATIYHPEYKSKIEKATLQGSFASGTYSDLRQGSLVLKNVRGELNGEPFQADFVLNNFVDPAIIFKFKGKLDASSVLGFYPIESIEEANGSLTTDIAFEGKIGLLKNKATAQRVSTQGTIDLNNITLTYGEHKIKLQQLNGSLQFSNNDLALSNVKGKLGKSDFLLNGFFKNVITFLLFDNQPIGIETDLKSAFLDLDEIFALSFGTKSAEKEEQYEFAISRNVNLNFNCDVTKLRYRKFNARNIKGDLLVKNEVAVSRNLSFQSMGGDMTLSGIVDAKNHKAIDLVSTVKLNGIHVDSAFYVFENFNQDFIKDKHLKGRTFAEVNLEMTFNQNLRLFPETLIADIGMVIKNGELNNFEPMKKLNKYLDDESLSKLRFSDIKNDIHIENKTVYIPQMEIRSNVTDLKVSGTHTFDQRIEYRIVTPLRRKRIVDVEAQNAIEETGGQSKLFLKIYGTTDNYRIAYDVEAVRKKIGNDIKREVQELKDAFKGKKQQKEIELQKDDYFDWDDQTPQDN
ncbi:DUF3971 domain-containing protein [Chryseosolibacter indicus]|uniref:AsmA-like C-terminal domain-containing protein n=1 Tax=Chryseosolibacter indicus TaxID=2782351 RepID=A0ABS5VP24_9BACT|nr:DUF3971 domain-containing protein [Chryseosolibacter indicus]MBT1702614.1 hypothetical protein [Chryseosolibacter indicus]